MVKIKLIYFHEKDTCHIVAVWDCRNNPKLLQDKLGEEFKQVDETLSAQIAAAFVKEEG